MKRFKGAAVLAALALSAYVVKIGGDFMHARLLLPSFFLALAPVSLVPVSHWRIPVYVAIIGWAAVCAVAWVWVTEARQRRVFDLWRLESRYVRT